MPRIHQSLCVVSIGLITGAAFLACSQDPLGDLFSPPPAEVDAGTLDAGPDAEAGCPLQLQACNTAGPDAPATCCESSERCCLSSVYGYDGADRCLLASEPCPIGCPDGTLCPPATYCQADANSTSYTCVDSCPFSSFCGGNLCCPLGSQCTGGTCLLPDLTIDQARIQNTVDLKVQTFSPTDCALIEGCIKAPGQRLLLRFDVRTPNVGQGDLYMGEPQNNPLFEFSDCHGHYHFSGYAHYRLLDQTGNEVESGHKQAFCLLDFEQNDPNASPMSHYTCDNQGIQSGWADVYGKNLDCQWVDVTDVAPGFYNLEVRLNEDQIVAEENFDNNVATVAVVIPSKSCPLGCRPPNEVCCQPNDPCGWGSDGSCDCAGFFGWDAMDCNACVSSDPDCDFSNSCPGGCNPNVGACCDPANPCGLDGNGTCDCGGAFSWDTSDCIGCTTNDPDCPVNSCPNGCTPPNPNDACCLDGAPCGWVNDGWCDCGGAAWDAADCATCISSDPDCP